MPDTLDLQNLEGKIDDNYEKLKNFCTELANILKRQDAVIHKLESRVKELEDGQVSKSGNRKVNGDPEKIAIALHLLYKAGESIRAVSDTGILSYSKTYGVYSWDEDYRNEWLDEHEVEHIYDNPKLSEYSKDIETLK